MGPVTDLPAQYKATRGDANGYHGAVDQRLWPVWILWLVPAAGRGRWLTAAAILAGSLLLFWSTGRLDADAPHSSPFVSLFFAAILAYIVPMAHYILVRTQEEFRLLLPEVELSAQEAARLEHRLSHKPPRWHLSTLTLGFLAGLAHNAVLMNAEGSVYRLPGLSPGEWVSLIATSLVWLTMTSAVAMMVDNAMAFARLTRSLRVDLLNAERLMPFARVALASTLVLVGAQALFPIMLIESNATALAVLPGFIATLGPIVLIFLLPIWPVHRRLSAAKARALANLNDRIAAAPRDDEDPAALRSLNELLSYRRELRLTSAWPFDVPILIRLMLYLILPPLTWVGAALIENLVDALL